MSTEGNECPTEDIVLLKTNVVVQQKTKIIVQQKTKIIVQQKTKVITKSHTPTKPIQSNTHLIQRGSQTACNRNLDYHDSCLRPSHD
jgi:hypothetical protein